MMKVVSTRETLEALIRNNPAALNWALPAKTNRLISWVSSRLRPALRALTA